MRKIIFIAFVIFSFKAVSQFPAPQNLNFSYYYYMLGDAGYCAGNWVTGATYCSSFYWNRPDTAGIQSVLNHYNLYYNDIYTFDTIIFASITDTFYEVEYGFIGYMWVTAVYRNPNGESGSSNVIYNNDLPTSIEKLNGKKEVDIFYNPHNKQIVFSNSKEIYKINVFNIQGCKVMSANLNSNKMNIEKLLNGIYIVETITNDNCVCREKLIIQ